MALRTDRLTALRKKLDLSQAELAERIGVALRTVQRYEGGESEPPFETAQALAQILGTTTEYLAGETDEPYKTLDITDLNPTELTLIASLRNGNTADAVEAFALLAKRG